MKPYGRCTCVELFLHVMRWLSLKGSLMVVDIGRYQRCKICITFFPFLIIFLHVAWKWRFLTGIKTVKELIITDRGFLTSHREASVCHFPLFSFNWSELVSRMIPHKYARNSVKMQHGNPARHVQFIIFNGYY